jgi:hypothetical protein
MRLIHSFHQIITLPQRASIWAFGLSLMINYSVQATTWSTDGSSSGVQAAVDKAAPGDTVTVPAGTFSGWNVTVSTAITLQGAGQDATTINGNGTTPVLSVSTGSAAARITGFTFNGGTSQSVLIQFWGNSPELLDQCSLLGGDASEMIHNMGMGASDNSGWTDGINPGSANAVYVENCTFTKQPLQDAYFRGTSAIESYYGARTVVRYCTFNACQVDQHGTAGMIGARWFELYNNTFYTPSGMNQSNYITLRGGSGVVFNNVNTGFNLTQGSIELYDENGGSSPLYLARGINQNYSPVYLWNNSASMPVVSGSANVIADRDFFVLATQPSIMTRGELSSDNAQTTYFYTPYVYPHPLDTSASPPPPLSSSSAPMPPTGLQVLSSH